MLKQVRETQKGSRECFFLVKAMRCCDYFPEGEIEKLKQPDFRITLNNGTRIGIEVTEYFRGQGKMGGSALRRDEKIRQKIADTAKMLYESKFNVPLWVTFNPCHNLKMKGKCEEDVATALVEVIIDNIPDTSSGETRIYLSETENPIFQNIFSSLWIKRLRGSKSSVWGIVEAGFTSINVKEIQGIIDGKLPKIPKYRCKCDLVWLLIVAEGRHLSSSIDTDWISKLNNHQFDSEFDCVLFYDDVAKAVEVLSFTGSAVLPAVTNLHFSNIKSPLPSAR